MANRPAQYQPSRVRAGPVLTADELNRIVDSLVRRIEGGKGIRVRAFGNRIVIEATDV